jgi:hypothetical protein
MPTTTGLVFTTQTHEKSTQHSGKATVWHVVTRVVNGVITSSAFAKLAGHGKTLA